MAFLRNGNVYPTTDKEWLRLTGHSRAASLALDFFDTTSAPNSKVLSMTRESWSPSQHKRRPSRWVTLACHDTRGRRCLFPYFRYAQNSAAIRIYYTAMDLFRPRLMHEKEFATHRLRDPTDNRIFYTAVPERITQVLPCPADACGRSAESANPH